MRKIVMIICLILIGSLIIIGCGQAKPITESSILETIETSDKMVTIENSTVSSESKSEQIANRLKTIIEENVSNAERNENMKTKNKIILKINGKELTATLVNNSSVEALKELLANGSMTILMRDYGNMEKVGDLGTRIPTNDEQITTEAGDLILYMGNAFVIYYAPNSWNFTRLGKIDNITAEELKDILGNGNVEVTMSLAL